METAQVWKEFREQMLGFIRSRVRRKDDAEDILQDVFLKIHQKLPGLKKEERLTSWVYQITRNAIIDFYRKKKIQLSEDLEKEVASMNESEEVVPDERFLNCMQPFIKRLPEAQQKAFRATVLGTMSQKEYAEQQKTAYSTVKSQVQRAREKVKQQVVACCSVELDRYGNVIDSKIDECNC
ncbi:MAG: RNA polymerase sigma factor SigZ [Bacteroidetes bacterium]|nr:MAG: RNA polymerase sigma factor SigZ [Bacteroidota bacterium]